MSNVVIGHRAEDYVHRNKVPTGIVSIGDGNVFRECVTVHTPEGERGGDLDGTTQIGSACYFMRGAHVGHDNVIGNQVTLSCNVCLAGFCRIGANVNLGIGTNVHQYTTIGRDCIVAMGSNVLCKNHAVGLLFLL